MDAFERLNKHILDHGVGKAELINPFWDKQLNKLRDLLRINSRPAPYQLAKALGYYDKHLPPGTKNSDAQGWSEVIHAIENPSEYPRGLVEHAGAVSVLKRGGLLDEYLRTIDELGLASSMPLARHFFYFNRLISLSKTLGRRRQIYLELGAGGGQFATLLATFGFSNHYVIVDLPEMLLNSMTNISQRFESASIRFGEKPDFSKDELCFWFLSTDEIELVPDASVTTSCNFNSLMEMDIDVRNFYIKNVYRCSAPGAIFYNVNRRQRAMTKRDGSTYDNNPLLYPYQASDRVIEWEPDQMQQDYRSERFQSPHLSFCISRIAIIN
jgi:putative sugar O-methyltransferase